jgi:hypothetical protein
MCCIPRSFASSPQLPSLASSPCNLLQARPAPILLLSPPLLTLSWSHADCSHALVHPARSKSRADPRQVPPHFFDTAIVFLFESRFKSAAASRRFTLWPAAEPRELNPLPTTTTGLRRSSWRLLASFPPPQRNRSKLTAGPGATVDGLCVRHALAWGCCWCCARCRIVQVPA